MALLLLIPQLVAAAPPAECKFQDVDVDPLTKKPPYVATEKVRLTNWLKNLIDREEHGHNSEFQATGIKEGDENFLALKVRLRRTSRSQPSDDDLRHGLTVPRNAELLVLMADRSVIKLRTDKTVTGNARYEIDEGFYIIDTGTTIRYRLDATAVEQLTQQDAERMRFNAIGRLGFIPANEYLDFKITDKAGSRLREAIACLQALESEDPA